MACGPKNKQNSTDLQATTASVSATDSIYPVYAQGFEVKYLPNHVRLVDLRDPQNESSNTFHYALVPRGTKPEGIPSDYTVIETPVRSAICMTSLQLSNFIKLEACDKVVGITSTRHLFNKEMNERLKSGKTAKIGIEGNFDNEVIMSVNPDVIFIYPLSSMNTSRSLITGLCINFHSFCFIKAKIPFHQKQKGQLYKKSNPSFPFFFPPFNKIFHLILQY